MSTITSNTQQLKQPRRSASKPKSSYKKKQEESVEVTNQNGAKFNKANSTDFPLS